MPSMRLDWSNDRHHEIVILGNRNVGDVVDALLSLARLIGNDPNLKAAPIRGAEIPSTGHHDAGAFARCSYCGREGDYAEIHDRP